MDKFNHYNILKLMIDNIDGVNLTFNDIYEYYVEEKVCLSTKTIDKVSHGMRSWIDCTEDVMTVLNQQEKHWFYIGIIRKHPEVIEYIPTKLYKLIDPDGNTFSKVFTPQPSNEEIKELYKLDKQKENSIMEAEGLPTWEDLLNNGMIEELEKSTRVKFGESSG